MTIEQLDEFAKNGQKSLDGLVQTDGFPANEKPARQWFNQLFNQLSLKINELINGKLDSNANATSASKLKNTVKIQGVEFDGSKDINLPKASTEAIGITQLVNDLVVGGNDKAVTAEVIKKLYSMFSTGTNNIKIPRLDDQNNPWIIQFGFIDGLDTGANGTRPFNFAFPNQALAILGSYSSFGNPSVNPIHLAINDRSGYKFWVKKIDNELSNDYFWLAIGY